MSARPRLLLFVAIVAAAFLGFALGVPHSPRELHGLVSRSHPWGPLVLVAAWVLLTPALCSGTLLAALGGLALGTLPGTAVGISGATLGGMVAFMIARRLGHVPAQELSGPRLRRLQERIERRGFVAVLAARAAPGVPSTLLNYACGLSRVRLLHFAAGSAIGGAPRILAYTALGGSGGDLGAPGALIAVAIIAVMGLGGGALVLGTRLRSRVVP